MRRAGCIAALISLAVAAAAPSRAGSASDPYCTGSYGGAPAHALPALRMGIDPGLAGSAGGSQIPTVPDDPARDLAAVKALAVPHRQLVVRLNRLFWSDGERGIRKFQRQVRMYTRAGFPVELQVRYHPPSGKEGDIRAWTAYVRHVVDVFGRNRRVVDMTITNEVNLTVSSNTSDGPYAGSEDALIRGTEAAHAEALRRGYRQLRFGFTYAYRWSPKSDAAFFSYLGTHGGRRFHQALSFIGLDFYPGTFYPPARSPGETYRADLAQAAGVLRKCFAPQAHIGRRVPIWITENGIPTNDHTSQAEQAAALEQLVRAAHAYSATYNITDYRWFNLRDSTDSGPQSQVALSFSTDGLLRANYARKKSFAAYRRMIRQVGKSR
ncbi:MAG: hypothetical protein ACJ764_10175 [Solirubrobacteraceae bacterium]